jgi:GNAT superfamily N-acetyltransferase
MNMPDTKLYRASFKMKLNDGTPALFRPITPDDKDRLKEGLAMLSPESRYLRFFSPVTRLSEEELRFFTEVDQVNHVAWGAINLEEPTRPGLGVARFVRPHDNPDLVEAAVTVLDQYQRKGLGTILVCLLYILAADLGVKTIRGAILPQNRFLIDWLHSLGGTTEYHEGAILVDMPVLKDTSILPSTPYSEKFRTILRQVRDLLYLEGDPHVR